MEKKHEEQSRYGDRDVSVKYDNQETTEQEIPGMVEDLRRVFNSERTSSYEWRVGQLNAFKRMLTECKDEFTEAMWEDLHKDHWEGWLVEISLLEAEIEHMLAHLSEWMDPNYEYSSSALNVPCWSSTVRDPLGVVLVMGAWNYPIYLSLCPMIGAIAAGNCVLMKPGSYAPHCSHALVRAIPRYLDRKAIKCVQGDRHMTTKLLEQRWDKIFFTGSGFVGRIIAKAAAQHLTPVTLELGGKSPAIVDKSANLEQAATRLLWGAFLNCGQTCVRPDFCLVHEDVADEFFKLLVSKKKEFYGENAQETKNFGRPINQTAYKRLTRIMEENKDFMITGGRTDPKDRFIDPCIFDFKTDEKAFHSSSLMRDELFGPLLPCFRYRNFEDVIRICKHLWTGKPLALYAFATDSSVIEQIKRRTTSGGLVINDCLMHLSNDTPFGGVGNSGLGAYHGKYSFDCFSHEKAVLEKSSMLDQSFLLKWALDCRFPPYNGFKHFIIGFAAKPWVSSAVNKQVVLIKWCIKVFFAAAFLWLLGLRITWQPPNFTLP